MDVMRRFFCWAGVAHLVVHLDNVVRHVRALLMRHPLLIRVYLILEAALLSLHTATLLLMCILYIREAILLATQMEPERIA